MFEGVDGGCDVVELSGMDTLFESWSFHCEMFELEDISRGGAVSKSLGMEFE